MSSFDSRQRKTASLSKLACMLGSAGIMLLPAYSAMGQQANPATSQDTVPPAQAWDQVPKGVSTQQLSVRASVLKSILLSRGWTSTTFDKAYNGPEQVVPTLDAIMDTYAYRVERDQRASNFYRDAGVILDGAFLAVGAFGPSGSVPSLVTTFGLEGAKRAASTATQDLMTHGSTETSKWLDQRLSELMVSDAHVFDNLIGKTVNEKLEILKNDRFIETMNKANLTEEDRKIADQFIIERLDWKLREGIERLQANVALQQKHGEQIAAVSGTLGQFMRATSGDIDAIRKTQGELKDRVDDLTEEVDQNRNDILLTQRILFDKMSSAEQVAALDNGYFGSLSPAGKQRLRTEAMVRQKQEELTRNLANFAKGATALANIAGNLGVDPNVVANIQTASAVADAAGAVVVGLATGPVGYIQAAAAIGGVLFGGGGGPDPAEARHQAIMEELGQVRAELQIVQQKLDLIIDGIKAIMQTQVDLSNQLRGVSELIDKYHNEEMEKLTDIQLHLVEIQATVNAVLFKDITKCVDFDNKLVALKFDRMRPVEYDSLREEFRTNRYGAGCLAGLDEHLGAAAFDGRYKLARYEGVDEAGDTWAPVHQRYKTIAGSLWEIAQQSGNADGYFQSLRAPVRRMQELDAKRTWSLDPARPKTPLFASLTLDEESAASATMAGLLKEGLSVDTIDRHVGFLLVDHPFFDLREALGDVENKPQQLLTAPVSTNGPYLLKHAQDLVDIAIAQQSLFAGDILLADLETAWRSNSPSWTSIGEALKNQPLLRQNLVTFMVRRAVIANSSFEAYAAIYGGDGAEARTMTAMKLALGTGFDLGWVTPPAGGFAATPDPIRLEASTGWQLAIPGGPKVPLPRPEAVTNGQLLQTPQLEKLLALRVKIAEELAGYEMPHELLAHQLSLVRGMAFANGGV